MKNKYIYNRVITSHIKYITTRIPSMILLIFSMGISACNNVSSNDKMVIENFDQLDKWIQQEVDQQNMVGLAVTRIDQKEVTWQGYYGKAQIEANVNVDLHTQFMIASISKTITATALMTLYDEGLFDLDDPINQALPQAIIHPKYPKKGITFRMLLDHTSAIIDDGYNELDLYSYGKDSPIQLKDFLLDYLTPQGQYYDQEWNFATYEPGEKEEYSNIASALIAYLVEELSGMPFDDYCELIIFTPLNMTRTAWRLADVDRDSLATPYGIDEQSYGNYTFPDYPNGQLFTTAMDLSTFLIMFMQNGTLGTTEILSYDTARLMKEISNPQASSSFGLHWFYMNMGGVSYLGHDGSEQGVTSMMFYDPTTQVGSVLLTNTDDANLELIFEEVVNLVLH